MKRTIITGLAGLIFSGCASTPISEKPKTLFREVPKLMVNHSLVRTYRVASKSDAIDDMRQLCTTASEEEAWFYLPQKNIWVEIGKTVSKEDQEKLLEKEREFHALAIRAVSLDTEYISDLLLTRVPVEGELFHIHTDKPLFDINPNPSLRQWYILSLPSRNDIVGACNRISTIKKKAGTTLTEHIVSSRGIASIILTQEGIRHFYMMEIKDLVKEVSRLYNPLLSTNVDNTTPIHSLTEMLSNEYVKVTYKAHQ